MKNLNKLLILVFFVAFLNNVFAQSSANYTFSTFTNGSLALDMNGNIVDMSTGTTLLIDKDIDNVRIAPQPIGFEFLMLYGTNNTYYRHTTFSVTSNGLLRLGEYLQTTRYNIGQNNDYGTISPLVRNLATSSTGKVHYKLVGTAPNRCLVVEWKNMELDVASTTADATYQARMYETTGIIEFVYGEMNVGVAGLATNYQIGISNDDGANTFISVQSSDNTISRAAVINNTYTAGAPIPNLHSTAEGLRRIYCFTPPSVPVAPTALAYDNIKCNSVRLNWDDNATNEVRYEIYQATNAAGPFIFQSLANKNATNTTIIGLTENTDYYFRVRAVTEGTVSSMVDLGLVTTSATCGVFETAQNGNWNVGSTWVGGQVPTGNDNAIVKHKVFINTDKSINNLTIENGGYLYFGATNGWDFQIYGDLTIDAGGRFHSAPDNSSVVYLYGNMIVNGEYDGNRGTNGTDFRFQGVDNKTITGEDATVCDFYTLTMNKGASKDAIVEAQRVITLREPAANGSSLVLSNGTFKLSSASVLSPYRGNYSVCGVTSKLWINNAGAEIKRVASNTGNFYIWDFQLDAGTLTNSGGISFYSDVLINNGTLQDFTGEISSSGLFISNNSVISATSYVDNFETQINGGSFTTTTGGYTVENFNKGISQINGATISIGADIDIENKLVITNSTVTIGDELYIDGNGLDEYGALDLNNSTMNVAAMTQITDFGVFNINNSTVNSGNGDDIFQIQQGSELIVSGGTINIFGRMVFDAGSASAQPKFTMSSGDINIDPQYTSSLTNADAVVFTDFTIVDFTGGKLTIIDPLISKSNANQSEIEIQGIAGAKNFIGSTIQFGNGSSTSAQGSISGVRGFRISNHASVVLDNVVVLNTNPSIDRELMISNNISNTLNINNLILSNTESKLNLNGCVLNIYKDFANNGTVTGTTAASHLKFVGSVEQNFNGTGSVTGTFPLFTVQNTSATGVSSTFDISATTVSLLDGIYYNSGKILTVEGTTVGNLIFNPNIYTTGALRLAIPNNLNRNLNFPIGKTDNYQLDMFAVKTSGSGTGYITAEAIEGTTSGGVGGNGLRNPLNPEGVYWKIDNALSSVLLTQVANIQLNYSPTLSPARVIGLAKNAHDGATYNSIGGTISGDYLVSDNYDYVDVNPTGTVYLVVGEIDPLFGTYYVGTFDAGINPNPNRFFQSLTAVSQIMREKMVDDNVVFEMLSTYDHINETLPIVFDALMVTQPTYDVTIRPRAGVSGLLTQRDGANDEESLIFINGISKLTFDGRPEGTGTNVEWTFSNTRVSNPGPVFEFKNDASENTLKYLNLQSNIKIDTVGIVHFNKTTQTTGNDNNTISNCNIKGYNSGNYKIGISSCGIIGKTNSGNTISNCNIFDFGYDNSISKGIYLHSYTDNWIINGNSFYQTNDLIASTGVIETYAIFTNTGTNYRIYNNFIGGNASNCSGTWRLTNASTIYANRVFGIVTNNSSAYVYSNTITGFDITTNSTSTEGVFVGILNKGNGYTYIGLTNTFVPAGNTIGSMTDLDVIELTATGSGGYIHAINNTSSGGANIRYNNMGGISNVGLGGASTFLLVIRSSGGSATISDNTIGGNIANSIYNGNMLGGTTGTAYASGIESGANSTNWLSNNIIRNISTFTSGGGILRGIYSSQNTVFIQNNDIYNLITKNATTGTGNNSSIVAIGNSSSTQTISGNKIHSLENTNTGTGTYGIVGIYSASSNTTNSNIYNNFIHSFKTVGNKGTLTAIYLADGLTKVYNNMIRLGIDKNGNSLEKDNTIYGIHFYGTNLSFMDFYHNSIFIGGNVNTAGAINKTYAFLKRETLISNIQNNIFVNERSNTLGTGSHYAYYLNFDEGINTDYNIYKASGTGGILANYDGLDMINLRAMQNYSNGKDLHSGMGNPNFINALGDATSVNLHVQSPTPVEGMGINVALVTTDFDNETRSSFSATDIGADAGNFTFDASVDIYAPYFQYTALEPQNCGISTASIDVVIKDQGTGIDVGSKPRLYFRDNSLAWATDALWIEGVLVDAVNSIWRFSGSGLSDGKLYEYYFVAQDLATTPNLSYSKFNATTPLHTSVSAVTNYPDNNVDIDMFTVCVFPKPEYTIGNTIECNTILGHSCDFESLTNYGDFFYNMNSMLIDKNVICYVVGNTNESALIAAENFNDVGSGSQTITIKPYNASTKQLTCDNTVNKSQIRFEGAYRYTIDGQYFNGTTNDGNRWLNFVHEKNDQPVFQFKNDAQNNLINYSVIEGSSGLNPSGIIFFDAGISVGNNNNTISNNIITDKNQSPLNVIYSYGNSSFPNSSNSITSNLIYDFRQFAIWLTSTGNGDNWNISNNRIFNTVITDTLQNAIRLESGAGHLIQNNTIGGNAADNSGIWKNIGTSEFAGIYLSTANTSKTIVSGNTIQNILLSSTGTSTTRAIRAINNTWADITDNLIQNIEKKLRNQFYVISYYTSEPTTIARNTIRNITCNNNGDTDFYGIYVNNGWNDQNTINDNTVSDIKQLSTNSGSDFYGIYCEAGDATVNKNTIGGNNIGDKITVAGGYFEGISFRNGHSRRDITDNTIKNIELLNDQTFRGFYLDNMSDGTLFQMTGNTVDDITLSNSGNSTFIGYNLRDGLMNFDNNICGTNTLGIINAGIGNTYGIYLDTYTDANSVFQNNFIQNIFANGQFIGIYSDVNATLSVLSNTISDINLTADVSFSGIKKTTGNLTIQNNIVRDISLSNSGSNTSLRGVWITGGSYTITNNTISDLASSGTGVSNIVDIASTSGGTFSVSNNLVKNISHSGNSILRAFNFNVGNTSILNVDNNRIFNFKNTNAGGANAYFTGIELFNTGKANITNNQIGNPLIADDISHSGNGWANAIFVYTGISGSTINSNTLSNITMNGNNYLAGIQVAQTGTGSATILDNNVLQDIKNSSTGASASLKGIKIGTSNSGLYSVTNNQLSRFNHSGNSSLHAFEIETTTNGQTISSNTIDDVNITGDNNSSIVYINSAGICTFSLNTIQNISSTNALNTLSGIEVLNIGAHSISQNTLQNFTSGSENTSFNTGLLALQGIHARDNGSFVISANQITDFTLTGNTASHLAGFSEAAPNAVFSNNKIWDLKNQSTLAGKTVNGIVLTKLNNGYLANNQISLGANDDAQYRGIWFATDDLATRKVYFNSIYIGGTATGSNSYALYGNDSEVNLSVKNNIFANYRTGGSGKHYAIGFVYVTNISENSLNANAYYSITPATCGLWNTNDVNFNTWITNSGEKRLALGTNQEPLFTDAINCNLHLNAANACGFNSIGIPILGITTDIDAETRNATRPDIGVDEFTPTAHVGKYVWRGWDSEDWDFSQNWQCEFVPEVATIELVQISDAGFAAVIDRPSPYETLVLNQLQILEGAQMTLAPNNSLTLNGDLNIAGTLTLKSPTNSGATATLLDNGTINYTGLGKIQVERFIPRLEWHYVSIPTTTESSELFTTSPNGWNPNFLKYSEPYDGIGTTDWKDYAQAWLHAHDGNGNPQTLVPGVGYANIDNGYKTVTASGFVNNADVNVPIYFTANDLDSKDGWNLVGNPFPSALNWDEATWDKSNIDNTVYYWNQDASISNYSYYNGATGSESGGVSPLTLNNGSQYIPVMQGFFVHAKSSVGSGANFTLPNSARVHSTQTFWKKGNTKHDNLVKLSIEKDGMSDETALRFLSSAIKEFDSDYDAYKMIADSNVPQIYTITEGKINLAINSLPFFTEYLSVPLGFNAKEDGTYNINILEISRYDLPSDVFIYLEDKEQNKMTEINTNDQYSFYSKAGFNNERFVIHFMKKTINFEGFEIQMYAAESNVFVNIKTNEIEFSGSIKIYNLLGVLVQEVNVENIPYIRIPVSQQGVYIVNAEINGQKETKKIFIK